MVEKVNLGEVWNGHDTDGELSRLSRSDVNFIVGKDTKDEDMKCGGRLNLDNHLRKIAVITLNYGECLVQKTCLIGYNKKD